MKHNNKSSRSQARLERVPRFVQNLITNPAAAREYLAFAPLARLIFAAGGSPMPDMGVREFDAGVTILKDALGIAPISDEEFECAVRLMTPPECRSTSDKDAV